MCVVCVCLLEDWSHQGLGCGEEGKTAVIFIVLIKMFLQFQPDTILAENVMQFPVEVIKSLLGVLALSSVVLFEAITVMQSLLTCSVRLS